MRLLGEDGAITLSSPALPTAPAAPSTGARLVDRLRLDHRERRRRISRQTASSRISSWTTCFDWCDDARTRILDAATLHERDRTLANLRRRFASRSCGPRRPFFSKSATGQSFWATTVLYGVVFWPQSGEYANSTNFLTSDEYRDHLDYFTIQQQLLGHRLADRRAGTAGTSFDQQTPHAPFFEPLFNALRATDDIPGLSEGLRTFLGSKSVQNRSDDDKTLIIASRQHAEDVA